MNIRQIELSEIDLIETLWNELKHYHQERTVDYAQHYLQANFSDRKTQLLAKDSSAIFIAEASGSCVGFCVVSMSANQGEVDSLFVQAKQRKCNVGKSLVDAGMKWLNAHDIDGIKLFVGQGNEAALVFYEKLGFKVRATMMEFIGTTA